MSRFLRRLSAAATLFSILLVIPPSARAQDTPALIFSTSPQNQPVSLTLDKPRLRYVFAVESLKDAVSGLRITATPFTDAAGNRIQPTVRGAGRAVGALQSLPIVVEADLPLPGAYTSNIYLIYNGRKWTPPLTLNVARVAPDLDVPDLSAARATLGSSIPVLEVGIHEKGGQQISLPVPQLLRFDRKEGTAARFTTPVKFTVKDKDDEPITTPIQIAEGKASHHLRFEVNGIDEAGEYEGLIRFSPPGASPISKTISIYVREALWWALFWIFIGVAISYLIREYLVKTRPRLVVLRRIEAAAIRLDEILKDSGLDEKERGLVSALRHLLSEMSTRLSLESISVTDADSTLDVFELKLSLLTDWLEIYSRAVKGNANPDAAIVAGLKEVETTLRNDAADKQAVDLASQKLAGLMASLGAAMNMAPGAVSRRQSVTVGSRATLEKLNRSIRTSDFLISVVVLAIACLLGVRTLWIGDLSWGGWEDRVIAVLWGLGLHQATFTGVEALRANLVK